MPLGLFDCTRSSPMSNTKLFICQARQALRCARPLHTTSMARRWGGARKGGAPSLRRCAGVLMRKYPTEYPTGVIPFATQSLEGGHGILKVGSHNACMHACVSADLALDNSFVFGPCARMRAHMRATMLCLTDCSRPAAFMYGGLVVFVVAYMRLQQGHYTLYE